MRKFFLSLLFVAAMTPACARLAGLSAGGGQSSTSLEPDGVKTEQETSTLPARMEASANELWAWYHAMSDKISPTIEPMKKLYVASQEMVVAVGAKDWLKALSLGATAWGLVDQIKGMVK